MATMSQVGGSISLTHEGILACAARYSVSELEAELLGSDFRREIEGGLNRDQLRRIVADWKLQSFSWANPANQLASNEDETIALFTREAFEADHPRVAAWLLCALNGVEVRSASAILTVFDPARYTILDARALKTLRAVNWEAMDMVRPGWLDESNYTTWLYERYLALCHVLESSFEVTLRQLDRALFYIDGDPAKYASA